MCKFMLCFAEESVVADENVQDEDRTSKRRAAKHVTRSQKSTRHKKTASKSENTYVETSSSASKKAVKSSAVGDQSCKEDSPRTCVFTEWIIKPLPKCQGICVEGKLK